MIPDLDLPGRPERTRIVVAMSGGVDSSVVAGLLKRAGYDVVGVTLQLYDHGEATHRKGACCAGQDIHDARRVAETLAYPPLCPRLRGALPPGGDRSFRGELCRRRDAGPCVACNQTVKFADLLETARRLGADALATGHYVRSARRGNGRALYRPVDLDRDQSYFLFATTPDQLDFLRFPLGGMTKAETREAARDLGLGVADKHDSQDICFVPTGRYADVIARLKPDAAEAGDIVHIDGRVVGRHAGIIHYTVGQRRGIGVAAGEPLYVIHLDRAGRRVIVGPRAALQTRRLHLRAVNWLGDVPLDELASDGLDVHARVRSTRPPLPARLFADAGQIFVDLADGEAGVAPGQACVFYDSAEPGARVLGGGWIDRAEHAAEAEAALLRLIAPRPVAAIV